MGGLEKRSFTLAGHRTSVALEPAFWAALQSWAEARQMRLSQLVVEVDAGRGTTPLASALRVAVLEYITSGGAAAASRN